MGLTVAEDYGLQPPPQGAWQTAGSHGARVGAENFHPHLKVRGREHHQRMVGSFRRLKGHPLVTHASSNRDITYNPSQTVPPTRDQAFKYISLEEPLSFKPPNQETAN